MVAKGGDRLLRDEAVAALRERLLPLAHLVTPNLPEAGALLGAPEPRDRAEMEAAAERLLGLGPANVLLKGGHLAGDASPDLLLGGGQQLWLESPRIATRHTHGTGCTLSSAITALLARGRPLADAVAEAKRWLTAGDRCRRRSRHRPAASGRSTISMRCGRPSIGPARMADAAPGVTIGIASPGLSGHAAVRAAALSPGGRQLDLPARPVRRRQDHAAAPDRRARRRRPGRGRRRRRTWRAGSR